MHTLPLARLAAFLSCLVLALGLGCSTFPSVSGLSEAFQGEITTPEQARQAGVALGTVYMRLHENYALAYQLLDSADKAWLREHVGPQLDRLKRLIIVFQGAVAAFDDAAAPPEGLAGTFQEIKELAADIAALLESLKGGV